MHPLVWLRRIRHRCGYGVHSPFAFHFITAIIYERAAYYKYAELAETEKQLAREKGKAWKGEARKVKRLLFRIANYAQPETTVDFGTLSASSLYLKAGCLRACYTGASALDELFLEAGQSIGLLYLHDYRHPDLVEKVFRLCVERTCPQSVFIIEGIRYTRQMSALWERMKEDERVCVSFDLYDLGILFFDKTKIKQTYIVNF